jgi:hypothetical protein
MTDRPQGLGLQVVAMMLAALVPVAWLVGRRTVPPTAPAPLALDASEPIVALQPGAEGLQAGPNPVHLTAPGDPQGAYRLDFSPGGGDPTASAPFRLKILGPGGREIWQGSWSGKADGRAEVVLPAEGLASGPHALVATDSVGRVRSFPFLVP